jgi:uridine kinase
VGVAIDGVDGSGKTTLADDLAHVLRELGCEVIRVGADGFLNLRDVRYRLGRRSPDGFWLDSYDYDALRTHVLDPPPQAGGPPWPGGSRRYRRAVRDVASDQPIDSAVQIAAPGAVLVLDGLFLHRDELAGLWDVSVFIDVPFAITAARMAERDGTNVDPDDPSMARYVEGQRLYFAACDPSSRATFVIDNAIPDSPRVKAGE